MKRITLNQYALFIAFMVIVIMAFIIPSFSNFVDTKIDHSAGVARVTKAGDESGSGLSQRYGKNLQIRLLVEDNGVF